MAYQILLARAERLPHNFLQDIDQSPRCRILFLSMHTNEVEGCQDTVCRESSWSAMVNGCMFTWTRKRSAPSMDQACSYANSCAMIYRNNHIDIFIDGNHQRARTCEHLRSPRRDTTARAPVSPTPRVRVGQNSPIRSITSVKKHHKNLYPPIQNRIFDLFCLLYIAHHRAIKASKTQISKHRQGKKPRVPRHSFRKSQKKKIEEKRLHAVKG